MEERGNVNDFRCRHNKNLIERMKCALMADKFIAAHLNGQEEPGRPNFNRIPPFYEECTVVLPCYVARQSAKGIKTSLIGFPL